MENESKQKLLLSTTVVVSIFYLIFAMSQTSLPTSIANWIIPFSAALMIGSKSKVDTKFKYLIFILFILYIFVLYQYVLYLSVEFFNMNNYHGDFGLTEENLNLIPFASILGTLNDHLFVLPKYVQLLGNLLLLTPFAFALLHLRIVQSSKKVVISLFITTLFIESAQLIQTYTLTGFTQRAGVGRATDVDDIILNTLSAVIGVGIYRLYSLVIDRFKLSGSGS
ncbi:VanZ family protein [Halobacillus yeomjeoni]|uniref:VanZ family protein n=1 Tax=Halobacillus yeomjeoni TaxID=311194 RepID=UPI001CD692EE|nr:VanZ family protein [Halobacillus yeomjeoni]MCA0984273.1 VanZ family protein [Halobacillus yeomjeoni]